MKHLLITLMLFSFVGCSHVHINEKCTTWIRCNKSRNVEDYEIYSITPKEWARNKNTNGYYRCESVGSYQCNEMYWWWQK